MDEVKTKLWNLSDSSCSDTFMFRCFSESRCLQECEAQVLESGELGAALAQLSPGRCGSSAANGAVDADDR